MEQESKHRSIANLIRRFREDPPTPPWERSRKHAHALVSARDKNEKRAETGDSEQNIADELNKSFESANSVLTRALNIIPDHEDQDKSATSAGGTLSHRERQYSKQAEKHIALSQHSSPILASNNSVMTSISEITNDNFSESYELHGDGLSTPPRRESPNPMRSLRASTPSTTINSSSPPLRTPARGHDPNHSANATPSNYSPQRIFSLSPALGFADRIPPLSPQKMMTSTTRITRRSFSSYASGSAPSNKVRSVSVETQTYEADLSSSDGKQLTNGSNDDAKSSTSGAQEGIRGYQVPSQSLQLARKILGSTGEVETGHLDAQTDPNAKNSISTGTSTGTNTEPKVPAVPEAGIQFDGLTSPPSNSTQTPFFDRSPSPRISPPSLPSSNVPLPPSIAQLSSLSTLVNYTHPYADASKALRTGYVPSAVLQLESASTIVARLRERLLKAHNDPSSDNGLGGGLDFSGTTATGSLLSAAASPATSAGIRPPLGGYNTSAMGVASPRPIMHTSSVHSCSCTHAAPAPSEDSSRVSSRSHRSSSVASSASASKIRERRLSGISAAEDQHDGLQEKDKVAKKKDKAKAHSKDSGKKKHRKKKDHDASPGGKSSKQNKLNKATALLTEYLFKVQASAPASTPFPPSLASPYLATPLTAPSASPPPYPVTPPINQHHFSPSYAYSPMSHHMPSPYALPHTLPTPLLSSHAPSQAHLYSRASQSMVVPSMPPLTPHRMSPPTPPAPPHFTHSPSPIASAASGIAPLGNLASPGIAFPRAFIGETSNPNSLAATTSASTNTPATRVSPNSNLGSSPIGANHNLRSPVMPPRPISLASPPQIPHPNS